ncbi:MAG: hypothetical protein CIT01_06145 [Methanobacterium sp. BRmetb2]|jgi:hypothetical protein|nr:MAG: hypothetical protein CIT01_06145 [Methanobacterium sp. BRmetb2]
MKLNIIEKDVLNPLGETAGDKIYLTPIKSNIRNISYLDNTKPNADLILDTIQEELKKLNNIRITKPAGAPASDEAIQKACESDLVFLAVGDCGSCSTWVILDAIRLEKVGIPTISICSHKFSDFARMLAESHGAYGLRILELDHPIVGVDEDGIILKVQNIIPEIKKITKMK